MSFNNHVLLKNHTHNQDKKNIHSPNMFCAPCHISLVPTPTPWDPQALATTDLLYFTIAFLF